MNVYALRGHERPVRMIKFNADGDLLFTCSDDGYVVVWRTEKAEMVGKIKCASAVKSIDISRKSDFLITSEVAAGFGIYNPLTVSMRNNFLG